MTGMMAAHAANQIMAGKINEDSAAVQYSAWVGEWFMRDVLELSGLYRQLTPPPVWLGV